MDLRHRTNVLMSLTSLHAVLARHGSRACEVFASEAFSVHVCEYCEYFKFRRYITDEAVLRDVVASYDTFRESYNCLFVFSWYGYGMFNKNIFLQSCQHTSPRLGFKKPQGEGHEVANLSQTPYE